MNAVHENFFFSFLILYLFCENILQTNKMFGFKKKNQHIDTYFAIGKQTREFNAAN